MSICGPSDGQYEEQESGNPTRTLVTTHTTGTERARATDKCSFDIPISPALAPTMRRTKSGCVAVSPNNVVLRYLRHTSTHQ
jgi:hypothetical protein